MSLLRRGDNKPVGSGGGGQPPQKPGQPPQMTEEQRRQWEERRAAAEAQRRAAAGGLPGKSGPDIEGLKRRIQQKLMQELDPSMDVTRNRDEIRRQVQELFNAILTDENIVLAKNERERLFETIIADILGLGPLEALLADDTISEIMVNGPKMIFIERKGQLSLSGITFDSDEHVLRIIDRIVAPLGRRVDESSPLVDARLQDGSRVNVVIRPVALCGPTITIRKFSKKPLGIQDLIRFGSMTQEVADFLRACVLARLNMVVSGGTGSGKTTLLNVLSGFIPNDERIITVENAAELQLQQEHVVPLESRPANIEGKGEITIRDLVINCLRMRPERIVVGECRGAEALDMLQAMNTGHDGSLTTLHANTPRDAISRLEVMCLMAGMDLPLRAIREQIASAVDCICQQQRLRDGSRKILFITEIQGMEGEMITMTDVFEFEQTGIEKNKIIGRIRPTGIRPKFIERIEDAGISLPPSTFGIGQRR
ncbi:MAG: CpaF family protein [Anaerolineae bacterium]|nr:CpaF family protein [Anaerolineae bacterium]MDW8172430.1 CpaF family protein [Anaerolineae bacterium]